MRRRAILLALILAAIQFRATAMRSVAAVGDTLGTLDQRYHVSALILARLDTVCRPCAFGSSRDTPSPSAGLGMAQSSQYVVQPGDTLSGIAKRFASSLPAIMTANSIRNPDRVAAGMRIVIPVAGTLRDDLQAIRSLIETYSYQYGVEPSLALAVAWQESGFNQSMVSRTGAIGVMQIEPATGERVGQLWGRPIDLYNAGDNVRAGVYWLSTLMRKYAGNERLAVAAYYQGEEALSSSGMFPETAHYVDNVLALQGRFGG